MTPETPNDELTAAIARLLQLWCAQQPATTADDILLALEYIHACVEREADGTPKEKLS